jgi:hypothetical protein
MGDAMSYPLYTSDRLSTLPSWLRVAACLIVLLPAGADAQTYPLTYGGRLVDSSGAPLAGAVDLEVNFYGAESGGSKLGRSPFAFAATPTTDGVFSISLDLTPDDLAALFADPGTPTWIEIVDRTHGRTYPRQRFAAVPQALRIPLDEQTLEFDASGRLTVKAVPSAHIPELAAALQSKADASAVAALQTAVSSKLDAHAGLSGDLSGTVDAAVVAALQGKPVSAALPLAGQVLTFDGTQWEAGDPAAAAAITSSSVVNAGSLSSAQRAGVELKPYGAAAGTTGELRFDALAGGNYVGFKAPDAIAAPTVWTLPAADGASGQALTTNGSGSLVWSALPSAPVSSVAGRTGAVTLSTSDVSEGSALYYTDARARAAISGTAPITVNSTTGAIGIQPASGAANGYLSSADWTTFNDKQAALGYSPVNKAGDTMSGSLAMGNNKITGLADPAAAADATTKSYADANLGGAAFDQAARTNDYVIKWDAGDNKYYLAADQTGSAGGGITTINTLNASAQTLVFGASGTAPAVSSSGSTHTLNVPMASGAGVTAGLISKADYDGFSQKQAGITVASTVNAGTVTTALQNGLEVKPYGTGAGQTGETRFDELAANGSNFVGLKAADSLAGNVVWTLPASDGTSGQLLQTDGAGGLSWASGAAPTGAAGGDLTGNFPNPTLASSGVAAGTYPKVTVDAKGRVTSGSATITSTDIADGTIADADISGTAAIATSKLSGSVTAISGHGLGSLATLGEVGSTEVTDGSIANADISATAAISTSKLSGAVTSITGNGLGTLATLSAVGSAQITDGQVANVDISGTAAIATSKLSGPLTSISGHGLGSLAALNGIGSAEINDGSIANADISGTAAIATSKLSGPVTAIAGHGLGSLATSSAVSSGQITDGTITDDDISGSAAIADSKLATISTSGKVENSATTATSANTASAIVARDASGNFSANDVAASKVTLSSTLRLGQLASDPTGLGAGDKGLMWFNTTDSVVKVWDGAQVRLVNVTSTVPRFTGLTLPVPGLTMTVGSTGFTNITLSHATGGTTSVYTLDGEEPTADYANLIPYTSSFSILWDDASDLTFKYAAFNALYSDPSATRTIVFNRKQTALTPSLAFADNFTENNIAIAVTTTGASYISENSGCNCGVNEINRYDLNGSYVASFGTYGSGAGQMYGPRSITLDSSNNVYVAESGNNRIQKFSSTGTSLLTFGTNGQLATLSGTTILHASGTTVTKYNTSGVSQGSFSLTGSIRNNGLSSFSSTIYAATSGGIEIYNSAGTLQQTVTSLSYGGSTIPLSFATLGKVIKTSGGEFLFIWGGLIIRASSTWQWVSSYYPGGTPKDLAIDSSDRVYVVHGTESVGRFSL